MPAEITYQNAQDVRVAVLSAVGVRASVFVVDLTQTRFCDSSGIREVVNAYRLATATGLDFRLVLPPTAVLARLWTLRGLDQLIRSYPSLAAALGRPAPGAEGEVPAR